MSKKLKKYGIESGKNSIHAEIIYPLALLYHSIQQDISNYLRPFGLSMGKFNILMVVKNQGGQEGVKQVQISQHLIVTASNMTKMIDKLEQDSLVERFSQEGDRRVNLVRITSEGVKLLEQVWPGYDELLKSRVESLSLNQQKLLVKLLNEWLDKE